MNSGDWYHTHVIRGEVRLSGAAIRRDIAADQPETPRKGSKLRDTVTRPYASSD